MKVRKSTVEKLTVTGVPNMDSLSIIVEDFGQGRGEITITCFGESWNRYWSHMSEGVKMADFFIKASDGYLVLKLKTGISSMVNSDDQDALEAHLKARIVEMRRNEEVDKYEARELWSLAESTDYSSNENLYEILGDEWHLDLPQVTNPHYEYLCRVVGVVKEALKQQEEIK